MERKLVQKTPKGDPPPIANCWQVTQAWFERGRNVPGTNGRKGYDYRFLGEFHMRITMEVAGVRLNGEIIHSCPMVFN